MEKRCGIEILEIGSERNLAVIVDGFAASPERWRSEAAQCDLRSGMNFNENDLQLLKFFGRMSKCSTILYCKP